jgi:hypothetical protein
MALVYVKKQVGESLLLRGPGEYIAPDGARGTIVPEGSTILGDQPGEWRILWPDDTVTTIEFVAAVSVPDTAPPGLARHSTATEARH